eukprot:CAMPEP_0174846922 /NCGR_PEP_ID=MMETSP1114-20130205/12598_1 /TAXON_ID=312471 /ORGANISM="Neobodo designis, Strain CCAP 1951/1" /LENGTH=231 /DNA_ID=CAMNT_0016081193 /DNA_START=62 /DNA_END=754 /DNA_ORIENTATION=+
MDSGLQAFIGYPCVACRFVLAPGADLSTLCDTHRTMRNPPLHGCRFVALIRAPSIGARGAAADEFVSFDVYGSHELMTAATHRAQSLPHHLEAIARAVDIGSVRAWIGNVEDLPPQFIATAVSCLDSASDDAMYIHGGPLAKVSQAARRTDESHRSCASDSRTSSSSTVAQPASPPPEEASEKGSSNSSESARRAPVCPLDQRYWADVVFQPAARRPGAALFSGRVFSYGA